MRTFVMSVIVLGTVLAAGSNASAATILPPGSTWEYSFTTPESNWSTTLGGWQTGSAPFGNTVSYWEDPNHYFDWKTNWSTSDLWVRKGVNLTGFDLSTVRWDVGVDNGFYLYVNGNFVSSGWAEWYAYRWEYSGIIPEAYLHPGVNIIAVHAYDTGGLKAFDMQLTGEVAPVPEPSAVIRWLSLGVVGGVVAWRWRRLK